MRVCRPAMQYIRVASHGGSRSRQTPCCLRNFLAELWISVSKSDPERRSGEWHGTVAPLIKSFHLMPHNPPGICIIPHVIMYRFERNTLHPFYYWYQACVSAVIASACMASAESQPSNLEPQRHTVSRCVCHHDLIDASNSLLGNQPETAGTTSVGSRSYLHCWLRNNFRHLISMGVH